MIFDATITVSYLVEMVLLLLSIFGAFAVNEFCLIKKRRTLNEKHRVLQILLENRDINETFLRTLNSAIMLFGDDQKIKKSIYRFSEILKTGETSCRDEMLVNILYQMCHNLGYKHMSKNDINLVFLHKKESN